MTINKGEPSLQSIIYFALFLCPSACPLCSVVDPWIEFPHSCPSRSITCRPSTFHGSKFKVSSQNWNSSATQSWCLRIYIVVDSLTYGSQNGISIRLCIDFVALISNMFSPWTKNMFTSVFLSPESNFRGGVMALTTLRDQFPSWHAIWTELEKYQLKLTWLFSGLFRRNVPRTTLFRLWRYQWFRWLRRFCPACSSFHSSHRKLYFRGFFSDGSRPSESSILMPTQAFLSLISFRQSTLSLDVFRLRLFKCTEKRKEK